MRIPERLLASSPTDDDAFFQLEQDATTRRYRQTTGHARAVRTLLRELPSLSEREIDAQLWPVLESFSRVLSLQICEIAASMGLPIFGTAGDRDSLWAQVQEALPRYFTQADVDEAGSLVADACALCDVVLNETPSSEPLSLSVRSLSDFIPEVLQLLEGIDTGVTAAKDIERDMASE